MQTSSDNTHGNQDDRKNRMDDSLMMTIDYLRARLLSERSISKAAKERTDELATRVKELEQQLQVVTLQRKRAEKAALDVFSYLDSLGVTDMSEVYESDSNEEESQSRCVSNLDNGDTTKDDDNFCSFETKGSDKDPSGSEPESTPSSCRFLSWKGHKERTRLLGNKCLTAPIRNRTTLAQVTSSPRHRLAKSCRQIKRREPRSAVENLRRDCDMSDAQESNGVDCLDHCLDCLDLRSKELNESPGKCGDRGSCKEELSHSCQAQAQEGDTSSSRHKRECSGEMKRALEHQEQLIRCYEAQEKAQRDWEEKYGENDDSCEPGSHSDVTEEREEAKAAVPQPIEIDGCHGHDQKSGIETNSEGRRLLITRFNSFKLSSNADPECSKKDNVSEIQAPRSPAPDFAFFVASNNPSSKHAARHLLHGSDVNPSNNDSAFDDHQSLRENGPRELVPYGEPARMGMVLEALHEAKLLIKQRLNDLPETRSPVGRATETSVPANSDVDCLRLPVGCHGLFRVPTDLEGQALGQSKLLSLDFPSKISSSTLNPRSPAVQGHQYSFAPIGSRLGHYSSDRQPRYDFHFKTNVSASSKSNLLSSSTSRFPNFFPDGNQMIFSQFSGSEAGLPPSAYPLFQNHDVRPNAY